MKNPKEFIDTYKDFPKKELNLKMFLELFKNQNFQGTWFVSGMSSSQIHKKC